MANGLRFESEEHAKQALGGKYPEPRQSRKAPQRQDEYDEQVFLFRWIWANTEEYPGLELAYATLNGVRLTPGLAKKAKAAGHRSGVPDIVIPAPRKGYAGLYVELKAGRNQPTQDQKMYLRRLEEEGYKAVVRRGAGEAIEEIVAYFEPEPKEEPVRSPDYYQDPREKMLAELLDRICRLESELRSWARRCTDDGR